MTNDAKEVFPPRQKATPPGGSFVSQNSPPFSRILRVKALKMRYRELVNAARAQGGGRAATRHGGSARESAAACQPALFPGPGARALPGPDGRQRTPPGRGRRREPPGFRGDRLGASLRECPDQRLRALREERARWAAPSLAEGCVAADEELVPIHVVQA